MGLRPTRKGMKMGDNFSGEQARLFPVSALFFQKRPLFSQERPQTAAAGLRAGVCCLRFYPGTRTITPARRLAATVIGGCIPFSERERR
jgi:hypothetical protein